MAPDPTELRPIPPTAARYQRIAVCFHHGEYFGRVLRGIGRYARGRSKPWIFEHWWGSLDEALPSIARSRPDGMFVGHLSTETHAELRATGIPYVATVDEPWVDAPKAGNDDPRCGALAARHFLDKGLMTFGFCGFDSEPYSTERWAGFTGAVEAAGHAVDSCTFPYTFAALWRAADAIEGWLARLPKPAGVLACNDELGCLVLQLCQKSAVRVPEDVAVVGVDNSPVYCEFSYPPLSSIETGVERTGGAAAAMLDGLMSGHPPREPRVRTPPVGVVERQSTDVLAVTDPDIATAIRFIREHSDRPLRVGDVLRHAAVSRTTLEHHFRRILNRTPLQEIRRAHVERAKDLLVHTDLPIGDVAGRCGCPHLPTLSAIFRKVTGMTPTAYRRQFRATTQW